MMKEKIKKILVTGGGGFLGKHVCKTLLQNGFNVRSYSRKAYPKLEALGVEYYQGDLNSENDLYQASIPCQGIIHCAAKAGVWGKKADYENTNFLGTKNVVEVAKKLSIPLVYTSTPSVVFNGQDILGEDESLPYAKKTYCHYVSSKIKAESYVLQNAQQKNIRAIALRPHLIWGPGDPHILPRLRKKSQKNSLVQIGDAKNLVDTIYVENAAWAHLLALQSLLDSDKFSGKSYFLGQKSPVFLWDFIYNLLSACGETPIKRKISLRLSYFLGSLYEFIYKTIPWLAKKEPPLTRFVALQLTHSHYFSHSNIIKDLGFSPKVTTKEGLDLVSKFYNKVSPAGSSSPNN
jgi:2-alkyl-3-oxoalkanoate reductase